MDIYSLIKKDHDDTRALMERIMQSKSGDERETLLEELKQLVLLHAKTEEATWYSALTAFPQLAHKIEHTKEEHDTIEDLFAEVAGASGDDSEFLILFGEIKMGLEHHFHEEEDGMFPQSKELIGEDQARELGREMKELKDEYVDLTLRPHQELPDAPRPQV